jgi:hypothetical protein
MQDVGIEPEIAVGRQNDRLGETDGEGGRALASYMRTAKRRRDGLERTRAEIRVAACAASWLSCERTESSRATSSDAGAMRPAAISLASRMSKSTSARWSVSHMLRSVKEGPGGTDQRQNLAETLNGRRGRTRGSWSRPRRR